MKVFLMHIGHPGHIDVNFTVKRKRSVSELIDRLPVDAPERSFFECDKAFLQAFPNGHFHCWGVPALAKPSFERTRVGDLVLIAPWIGIHDGGIHYIGVVRAKCPIEATIASHVFWPETPYGRSYPWIFFFCAEAGRRPWFDFLEDLGYDERWNPQGWYRPIAEDRFVRWGGAEGYLEFLRTQSGFQLT